MPRVHMFALFYPEKSETGHKSEATYGNGDRCDVKVQNALLKVTHFIQSFVVHLLFTDFKENDISYGIFCTDRWKMTSFLFVSVIR